MYKAKIEEDKIVLTPSANPHFVNLPEKVIPLSEVSEQVGVITALDSDQTGNPHSYYLHLKGQVDPDFIVGPSLQDVRTSTPPLVEIESIDAFIPIELIFDEPQEGVRDRVDIFLCTVFNDIAAGRKNPNGYLTRAFVNPAAVDSVKDEGGYRSINIKPEYGGRTSIITPLPEDKLKKRLGLSAPAP